MLVGSFVTAPNIIKYVFNRPEIFISSAAAYFRLEKHFLLELLTSNIKILLKIQILKISFFFQLLSGRSTLNTSLVDKWLFFLNQRLNLSLKTPNE